MGERTNGAQVADLLEGEARRCGSQGNSSSGRLVKKEIKCGNPAILNNDEISARVSRRLTRVARYPLDPPAVAQFLGLGNWLISKVRVSSLDCACDAIDLVAATVDTPAGIVEQAIFGECLVDRRAPTRWIDFTEDVMKIAGQQGGYAVRRCGSFAKFLRKEGRVAASVLESSVQNISASPFRHFISDIEDTLPVWAVYVRGIQSGAYAGRLTLSDRPDPRRIRRIQVPITIRTGIRRGVYRPTTRAWRGKLPTPTTL